MKKLFLLLAALWSLSVGALADQLLYDADTGKRTVILKDDGRLLNTTHRVWGILEGEIIYDRKGMHSIGYRKGNVLYTNGGSVLAYAKNASVHWPKEPEPPKALIPLLN